MEQRAATWKADLRAEPKVARLVLRRLVAERAQDAQKLADLGCDSGQGFLFAKPMTEQELMSMVLAGRTGSEGVGQPSSKDAGVVNPAR